MPNEHVPPEQQRERAENMRERAEDSRHGAEQDRASTEEQRTAAESAREEAEQFRRLERKLGRSAISIVRRSKHSDKSGSNHGRPLRRRGSLVRGRASPPRPPVASCDALGMGHAARRLCCCGH